ncbi:MAG: hypothetical protein K1X79_11045, partial [Oligoflexia bacterium]|nr:hypothetical protein [Oligoflexia bacterium]
KGIGDKAIEAIIAARAKGSFIDLEDFVERVDLHAVNRRVFESLIKCGAFDASGATRRELFERLDDVLRFGQSLQRSDDTNQISLFGGSGQKATIPRRSGNRPEWPVNQKLAFEREALGFYISGHPLEKFKRDLKRLGVINTSDILAKAKQPELRVGGVITALKLKNTKKGDRYASFMLEDYTGSVEAIAWPDTYKQVAHILAADDPVICSGRANVSEERCTFIVNKVESLVALRDRSATQGLLMLTGNDNFEDRLDALLSVLQKHAGACPVKVKVEIDDAEVSLVLRDRSQATVAVAPSEALCEEVEQLFGRPVLSFF